MDEDIKIIVGTLLSFLTIIMKLSSKMCHSLASIKLFYMLQLLNNNIHFLCLKKLMVDN